MNSIGIMQGRLSPPFLNRIQAFPLYTWREEFFLGQQAGLSCIEWVYESDNESLNPVIAPEGRGEILELIKRTNVSVKSICADYYMAHRLVNADGSIDKKNILHLKNFIGLVSELKIHHIVLPFVDESSVRKIENKKNLIAALRSSANVAQSLKIEIHLETDLPPKDFFELLSEINHPSIKFNYDIGNSASLGFMPSEELTLLSPWLGSVHVKDRRLNGGTVPLGTGNADFATCFQLIKKAGFQGFYILQAAREEKDQEVELAIKNKKFIEKHVCSF